jgi:2,3-bisphosphoglycerate-independent phosphoglycerate mutase
LTFNTVEDLKAGRAVYQDFTNAQLIERGEQVDLRAPEEAADVLASIVARHRFTLYEYFITDKAGHAQDMTSARQVLQNLARMIRALLHQLDLQATTVILTSDHGNIEDLSTKSHTLNRVPTIIWGAQKESLSKQITSLADITPAIVSHLTQRRATTHV